MTYCTYFCVCIYLCIFHNMYILKCLWHVIVFVVLFICLLLCTIKFKAVHSLFGSVCVLSCIIYYLSLVSHVIVFVYVLSFICILLCTIKFKSVHSLSVCVLCHLLPITWAALTHMVNMLSNKVKPPSEIPKLFNNILPACL